MKLGCCGCFLKCFCTSWQSEIHWGVWEQKDWEFPSSSAFPLVFHEPQAAWLVIPHFAQAQYFCFSQEKGAEAVDTACGWAFQKESEQVFWKRTVNNPDSGSVKISPGMGRCLKATACPSRLECPLPPASRDLIMPTAHSHCLGQWDLRNTQQTQLILQNSSSKQKSPPSVLDFAIYSFSASH